MLQVERITKRFGGFVALREVSFTVSEGEIVGLIGPNGSGKTTLFNVISGTLPATAGRVLLQGEEITHLLPNAICQRGIARTFQIPRPFKVLTTVENVMLGAAFGKKRTLSPEEARARAEHYLQMVGLPIDGKMWPDELTVVDLKRLEIARALATEPRLLLVDEALGGLHHSEMAEATEMLKRIRDELGITIVWVEHIMSALMRVVDRVMVLHHGEKIAEGSPQEVANNPQVIDAYLGERFLAS
ncbi:MAG: ABC transporter ATP-binding protein [Nitrospinota bacterium]|nr:MAG: ABC transporter ATP-binding protein [Nitrospinota bacterium]